MEAVPKCSRDLAGSIVIRPEAREVWYLPCFALLAALCLLRCAAELHISGMVRLRW